MPPMASTTDACSACPTRGNDARLSCCRAASSPRPASLPARPALPRRQAADSPCPGRPPAGRRMSWRRPLAPSAAAHLRAASSPSPGSPLRRPLALSASVRLHAHQLALSWLADAPPPRPVLARRRAAHCPAGHRALQAQPPARPALGDSPAVYNSVTSDESKALAQALQEKMEVLMLFSQEQERYLLEKQRNQIIIEDLQKNLSQVKDEKVKVLMELAKLKEENLLLKGSSVKESHGIGDSLKDNPEHHQHGMLKTMLKRTTLSHWMRKDSSSIGRSSTGGNDHTVCKEHSVDIARLKVENATLMESVGTVERLTSSVHRLHDVLLKAYDDVKSSGSLESTYEALSSVITEANLMKTAVGVVLPVSWSGDSSDATTFEALYDPSDSPKSKSERVDPLSSAGMEMMELLILAAEILKESFVLKK